jgi:hypothetical protein
MGPLCLSLLARSVSVSEAQPAHQARRVPVYAHRFIPLIRSTLLDCLPVCAAPGSEGPGADDDERIATQHTSGSSANESARARPTTLAREESALPVGLSARAAPASGAPGADEDDIGTQHASGSSANESARTRPTTLAREWPSENCEAVLVC